MSKGKAHDAAAAAEKALLRERLPRLISDATSNPEAAQAALHACIALKRKPPISLLTEENINALSPVEILKLMPVLVDTKRLVDLKGPLTSLRLAGRRLREPPSRNALAQISKTLISEVNKILKNQHTAVRFTDGTVSALNANLLWLLPELFQQKKKSKTDLPLAANLLGALDRVWRHSIQPKTAAAVVELFGSLRGSLPPSVFWDLTENPLVGQLARDSESALHDEATAALKEGRLRDLQRIFRLIKDSEDRKTLIRRLEEICIKNPSQVPTEAADWLAREAQAGVSRPTKLTAADKSQSSELNYVVVSLLDAWDAAVEGHRSLRSLESIRRLGCEIFNVEFFGDKGDVVEYDELKHELQEPPTSRPLSVEIIRPGVQHSDGGRTSFLVRALAKALN
jgi:hypothetical protein